MRVAALLLVSLALTACGDPLIVRGDLPGFMRIVAGLPGLPGQQVGMSATSSRLTSPSGLAVRAGGDLIVVDSRRILSISSAGRVTVLHHGSECFDHSCLTIPQGVALLGNEAMLIADNGADRVWRFDLQARVLSTFAGTGTHGVAPDGTPAASATLASPGDVVVLPDGRVLITERNANRVRVVNADGRLHTFAGTGTAGHAGDNGPATAAQLFTPTGLALHNSTLYIAESDNHVVRAIDLATGTIRTVAGIGVAGFAGDGGPALQATLNLPWAAEISADGQTLFFTDIGNHRVRTLNLADGTITTFAGTGLTAYNGNGRSAGETALQSPYGLALDPMGFLYVADTGHHIVWRTPVRF